MTPRIAVLHHPGSFSPMDLIAEIHGRFDLLWVIDEASAHDRMAARLLRRMGTVVDISGLDHDAAAAALAEHDVDGVVTFVDDNLLLGAALASRLGLRFHTPAVAADLADKCRQRAALAAAGVPGPRWWPVPATITATSLAELADDIIYPAVLKPARGSGSRGIRHLTGPDDLATGLAEDATGVDHLVEEYLADDPDRDQRFASYFSVETVVDGGTVRHVALTGRFPLAEPFRETGNFIPAVLPPTIRAEAMAMVDRAVAALGIEVAVIHTEIKLTAGGLRLIEVNGRLAGRPPFILNRQSSVNLFVVACQLAAGCAVDLDGDEAVDEVGFWLMVQPPVVAERLTSVAGLDAASALDGVDSVSLNRSVGDPVDWRDGTAAAVVTVRGLVPDHDALAETIVDVRDQIQVTYQGGGDRGASSGDA